MAKWIKNCSELSIKKKKKGKKEQEETQKKGTRRDTTTTKKGKKKETMSEAALIDAVREGFPGNIKIEAALNNLPKDTRPCLTNTPPDDFLPNTIDDRGNDHNLDPNPQETTTPQSMHMFSRECGTTSISRGLLLVSPMRQDNVEFSEDTRYRLILQQLGFDSATIAGLIPGEDVATLQIMEKEIQHATVSNCSPAFRTEYAHTFGVFSSKLKKLQPCGSTRTDDEEQPDPVVIVVVKEEEEKEEKAQPPAIYGEEEKKDSEPEKKGPQTVAEMEKKEQEEEKRKPKAEQTRTREKKENLVPAKKYTVAEKGTDEAEEGVGKEPSKRKPNWVFGQAFLFFMAFGVLAQFVTATDFRHKTLVHTFGVLLVCVFLAVVKMNAFRDSAMAFLFFGVMVWSRADLTVLPSFFFVGGVLFTFAMLVGITEVHTIEKVTRVLLLTAVWALGVYFDVVHWAHSGVFSPFLLVVFANRIVNDPLSFGTLALAYMRDVGGLIHIIFMFAGVCQ